MWLLAQPLTVVAMESRDEVAGAAIATYRAFAGMSQSELARKLDERGVSMAQQTVAKIEAGTRPLKLTEAAEIAEELGVTVADLLNPTDLIASRELLKHSENSILEALSKLSAAVWEYENARVQAAAMVARGDLSPDARFRSEVDSLRRLVQLKSYDYEAERMYQIHSAMQGLPLDERLAVANLLGVSAEIAE